MKEDYSNIDHLIVSFLEGGLTAAEKQLLQDWLAEDTAHEIYFKQIYKIWVASSMLNPDITAVEKALSRVSPQIQQSLPLQGKVVKFRTKRLLLNIGKWAAVVFVSLCTGAFIYSKLIKPSTYIANEAVAVHEINVPLGSKSQVKLPDGTEVFLNAGSKLTYTTDYGKVKRDVELSGEAYFKVFKLKSKPFVVHTSKTSIEALGTEFNVKAYPNENVIETILVEGSVVVHKTDIDKKAAGSKEGESIILKPGQMLQILKNPVEADPSVARPLANNEIIEKIKPIETRPDMIIGVIDAQTETSWKDNRWIIKGTNMAELAVLLSRRFNVNIQLKDSALRQYKFTGLFENETLEEVLDIIEFTVPVKSKIDKGDVKWSVDHEREKDYKEAYK